jgi:hypothetical protein
LRAGLDVPAMKNPPVAGTLFRYGFVKPASLDAVLKALTVVASPVSTSV